MAGRLIRGVPGLVKAAAPLVLCAAVLIAVLSAWVAVGGGGTIARVRIAVQGAAIPLPATSDATAAYLTITNSGDEPDDLLSVHTAVSSDAMLGLNSAQGGDGTMTMLSRVAIPAHTTVTLDPYGVDVMLMSPTPLRVGEQVRLTLQFRVVGTLTVTATVTPIGTA